MTVLVVISHIYANCHNQQQIVDDNMVTSLLLLPASLPAFLPHILVILQNIVGISHTAGFAERTPSVTHFKANT